MTTVAAMTKPEDMRISRINSVEGFDTLRPHWNELVKQTDSNNIFLTFDWLHSWWRVFGQDHQLCILTMTVDGKIVGLVPLMITKSFGLLGRCRVIRFIGTPDVDYCDFLGQDKGAICRAVVHYLCEHRQDWDKIELSQIPQSFALLPELESALSRQELPFRKRVIETCLAYQFEGTAAEREQFVAKKGHTVKRAINNFKRRTELSLERVDNVTEMDSDLNILFQLHINRWRETPTPSRFRESVHREFHRELIETLGPLGQIYFVRCAVGDLPISCSLNFEYNGAIYHYTLAYNRFFHKLSPGKMHVTLQTEMLIRQGYYLDFSRGAADYKKTLTNRSANNYILEVFGNRRDFLIARARTRFMASGLVRKLASNQRLWAFRMRVGQVLDEHGLSGLFKYLVGVAMSAIVDLRTTLVYSFDGSRKSVDKVVIEDMKCRKLTPDDVDRIAVLYGVREESSEHKTNIKRLQYSEDCFGVLRWNQLVAVIWGLHNENWDVPFGVNMSSDRRNVVLTDLCVSSICEGFGIEKLLLSHVVAHYSDQGIPVTMVVDKSNRELVQTMDRLGFAIDKKLRELKIFGKSIS